MSRRRPVTWIRDVALDAVPNALLRRLGGSSRIANLKSHLRHVRDLLSPEGPGVAPGELLEQMVEALYALPLDAFPDLLRDLFAAFRFDAEVIPGGSDETWEAAGVVSARGLADVPLRVWVSRARRDVDVDAVFESRGSLAADEQGTLITLGVSRTGRGRRPPPRAARTSD